MLALACTSVCYSAEPPRAGDAFRDIQEKPKVPPPGAPIQMSPGAKRAVKPIAGLQVDVKAFRFTGGPDELSG